jgi:ssDNA-binding Zn-finger/Zn-ribbon topoisomerase 1
MNDVSECPKCGAAMLQNAWDYRGRMFAACGSRIYVEGTSEEPSEHTSQCKLAAAEARVKVLEGEVERLRKTMTKLAIGDYEPINGSFTSAVATMAIAALARPANQGDKA